MAMTLRLNATQTAALRRRAVTEGTSMHDVVLRALAQYIEAHEPEIPIEVVIDQELDRFAGAVEQLRTWQD